MGRWWEDAVVYQVYVRSFADGDGDGIGDLEGLRQRLDHIAGLGVDAIWLTPIFPSPQRDGGYDVADHVGIDADYGDLAAFARLVETAHGLGLRVVLDIVPNHCSDAHPWFAAARRAGRDSDERARFYFRDGRDGGPPNNWQAVFGGSAWTPVGGDDPQWYLGTYTPYQPDLDHDHPAVDELFTDALRTWFDRGVDGFRVDAVSAVGKAPELPDAAEGTPVRWNPATRFRPEGHRVWRRWRRVLDEYEADHPGREVMMIAEAYAPHRPDLMAEYVRPGEFHQVFAFDLLLSPWHAPTMRQAVIDAIDHVGRHGTWPAFVLGNHDTERLVTRLGRADAASAEAWTGDNLRLTRGQLDLRVGERRARAAVGLLLGLPGAVYLYQGDELGLPEVLDLADEARRDPLFERTGAQTRGRDGCRIPLPWTAAADRWHGFSTARVAEGATPWLPQPAGWGTWAADLHVGDDGSMLELHRRLIAARRRLPPPDPVTTIVEASPEHDALVVVRRGEVVIACNTGGDDVCVGSARDLRAVVTTAAEGGGAAGVVPPDTTIWFAP